MKQWIPAFLQKTKSISHYDQGEKIIYDHSENQNQGYKPLIFYSI